LKYKIYLAIIAIALGLGASSQAQVTSANLDGTVTDQSHASVPGAHVVVTNLDTDAMTETRADQRGTYTMRSLPPGHYKVTTTSQGFTESVQTGITLTVGQNATLPVVLKVGSTSESVTVNASADLINSTTSELSQVMGETTVRELPLNGRDPSALVTLSAGVTNELQSQASTLPTSNSFPTESGASAGGGRQGSTWYLLDGVSNMDTFALLAAPFPNADATQEFRVISNNFDARYGFAPGAVVSIQTKGGANDFHGGVFEFIRNGALNAKNYFSDAVDPLKRNQFGGFVGGRIIRDKLFFFLNYQGTRSSTATTANTANTPTAAMLRGDFTAVGTTLTGPFVNNKVDPALFNSAAVKIAALLPLGQDPATGLLRYSNPTQRDNYDEGMGRLDYTISPKQQVFLRNFIYEYTRPGIASATNLLAGIVGSKGIYLNDAIGHTWTMSPTLLNSVTLAYSSIDYSTGTTGTAANGSSLCLSQFITVNDPPTGCYLGVGAFQGNSLYGGGQGFNTFSSNFNDTRRRDWLFSDIVTKVIGQHTFAVGTDVIHRYAFETYGGSQNPAVGFNGQYTNNELADFLLGDLQSFSQGAGESGSTSGWMLGLYAQDQWKVTPKLAINAGLRWDPNLALQVANGRGAAFRPGQQSLRYPNAPLGLVFPGDTGISDGLMPSSYGYLEPRLGIAWHVLPNTSVRASFGLFTTPLEDAFYNHVWDTAPFAPSYTLNGTTSTPLSFNNPWAGLTSTGGKSPFPPFASPGQIPASTAQFVTPLNLPAVFASNFKLGITQSWNLSVEQQFTPTVALHLAYVGAQSFHQSTTVERNPGIYADGGNRDQFPNFGSIIEVQTGGTATYHALQVGIEKRFSHGFQVQSNFTWSHSTDVGGSGDPSFESSVSDPFNVGHDRGPSSLNYPTVSVSNFLYEAPKLSGKHRLVQNTLGGWQVSGIVTLQSGPPFTINGGNGNNNSGFQVGQDRADLTGQPFQVRQGGKANWLNHYFNTAAFTTNALGTPGNSPKFLLQEAPIYTADLGVAKNWSYRERYKLQFRWEAFNALNHPSFGQPDSNPSDGNFGQITSTGAVPPRVMQGALKLTF
jgi:hypothetical protein